MKVGIALPTMVPGLTRDILLSWMREVDEGPFSVLACGEQGVGVLGHLVSLGRRP